jgi:uracil-DNA glycosylase family protein
VPKSASIPAEEPSASRTFIPETYSLATLTYAAGACTACDLYQRGTQVVFGEGPKSARLMLIGEQPGDQEDREGKPFVGPAGRLLDRVLARSASTAATSTSPTPSNIFKWEPRGKRRLHVKPNASEVQACRAWLLAELSVITPAMIVCLGAVAAQSFLGPTISVIRDHGQIYAGTPWAPWLMATYHPSALLRMPDETTREAALEAFTADLQRAADTLARAKASRAS